jgi:predicted TIM-barrel fold metal-dependent hydrolase
MRIVDTHFHLIDLDGLRYPWLDDVAALNRSFRVAEYLEAASPAGIDRMLHMEVDVAEAGQERETATALKTGRGVIGAIAACRPENSDFPTVMERVVADTRVKGFRRVLHTGAHDLAQTPIFTENLRLLARVGRPFDLCLWPRHLPIAKHLAAACPDVQFILDHCGMPDIKNRDFEAWKHPIQDLARLPNIACKILGIIAYVDPTNWSINDLRPYVEHVISCFGWDRIVWGSDWPVCTLTAELGRWIAATFELLQGTSASERERLLSRNAERIYALAAAA